MTQALIVPPAMCMQKFISIRALRAALIAASGPQSGRLEELENTSTTSIHDVDYRFYASRMQAASTCIRFVARALPLQASLRNLRCTCSPGNTAHYDRTSHPAWQLAFFPRSDWSLNKHW